jgi:hypothetical protein
MEEFLLCSVFLLVIMLAMSIGLLRGRSVKGSCGGVDNVCAVCGNDPVQKKLTQLNKN